MLLDEHTVHRNASATSTHTSKEKKINPQLHLYSIQWNKIQAAVAELLGLERGPSSLVKIGLTHGNH